MKNKIIKFFFCWVKIFIYCRLWDATPAHIQSNLETPAREDVETTFRRRRWDETPRTERGGNFKIIVRNFLLKLSFQIM